MPENEIVYTATGGTITVDGVTQNPDGELSRTIGSLYHAELRGFADFDVVRGEADEGGETDARR